MIFLYLVLFLPYIRGYIPNVSLRVSQRVSRVHADGQYPKWQESARLRVIVPVRLSAYVLGKSPERIPTNSHTNVKLLTASIFLGWSGYVVSLSQAGKRTVLSALKDAAVDAAKSGLKTASTQRPMGLLSAIGGSTSFSSVNAGHDQMLTKATALYSLTIGILGFIPTPKNAPVRKND